MAEGKKSFVAYADWKNVFDALPNEEAGALIKHIFAYVNDEDPVSDSVLINAVFANIKSTLKRDLERWEKQIEQRREAGKRSAEIRSTKLNDRSTTVNDRQRNSTDNVNVNVNVIKEKEELHSSKKKNDSFNFRKALIQENFDPKLVEDWIQVRNTKRAANTETAFKIFLNQILLAERTKGIDRNELLELTVSRSWQTFKIEYLENLNQNNNAQRQQPTGAEQRRNAEQEILRRSLAGD